jgi:hypothetical protein
MTQRNEPRMIAAAGLIGDTSRTFRSTGFDLGNAVGNEKWSCSAIRGYGSYPFADEMTLSKSRESSGLSLIRRKVSCGLNCAWKGYSCSIPGYTGANNVSDVEMGLNAKA